MEKLKEKVSHGDVTIVDVRSPMEFAGGQVVGSLNIPLNEVPYRLDEFKEMKHVVLCCASGGRSMQATMYLKDQGISCENGGSWLNVNYELNQD